MLFPLRSLIRLQSFPAITLLIIIVNVFCFLFEQALNPYGQRILVYQYALVPDRLRLTSLVTSMFMHAGWMHLIGNMWFLWIFGNNIEDVCGHFRFVAFYVLAGVAAAGAHILAEPLSTVPLVGASGAISAVLGAYLLKHPQARI